MDVTCDKCGTQYAIPDEKLSDKRMKAKCKKCDGFIIVPPLNRVLNSSPLKEVSASTKSEQAEKLLVSADVSISKEKMSSKRPAVNLVLNAKNLLIVLLIFTLLSGLVSVFKSGGNDPLPVDKLEAYIEEVVLANEGLTLSEMEAMRPEGDGIVRRNACYKMLVQPLDDAGYDPEETVLSLLHKLESKDLTLEQMQMAWLVLNLFSSCADFFEKDEVISLSKEELVLKIAELKL